jgi:uncharacterized membrane protein
MTARLKSSLFFEKNFRWRAGEITRLEGFTDAVFAFAVTLLVVSLEVPRTFSELARVMKGFVAFGICFAMLVLVWKEHVVYFRRYALQTPFVVLLNCLLLFLVLFYVYPLKFLFSMLIAQWSGGVLATADVHEPVILRDQVPILMLLYALGFAAVYAILTTLYAYAYRHRAELELDQIETLKTRRSLIDHAAMMSIGLLSMVLAVVLPADLAGIPGLTFFLIPVYFSFSGSYFGKRLRKLENARAVAGANDDSH